MPITRVVVEGYNSNVFLNKIPYYSQFRPTSVGTCSLWLDGADPAGNGVVPAAGNLATWVDKSSSAINAIAGTAVYPQYNRAFLNGLGVVGLTNAADYFTVANNFNSPSLTYVFLMKPTAANTGGNCGLLSTDTSGLYGRSIALNNMVFQIEYYNGFTATSVTTNSTTWYIISVVFNGTSSITLSYNGVISTYAGSGTGTNSSGLTIGSYNNASSYTTYNANFYLAEALMYTTALSQTEFQQVESYLAQKWGLSASLAAGHLDKTFPAGSPTAIQPYTTSVQTVLGVRFFPPGIPTISAPTNTNNVTTLTMSWIEPLVIRTDGTVTGYIVYILAGGSLVSGTGIGTGGTQTLGKVLVANFTPMTTNIAYSYYVQGTGPGGSGSVSATSSTAIYYAAPSAPTVLTVTNTGSTFNTGWTAPSGTITAYTVYVLAAGIYIGTPIILGNVTSTTYSPMTTNVAYSFYVTATNTIAGATSGNSLTSSTVIYYAPPGQPTVNTPTNTGNITTLTMTWSAASGTVSNYTVFVLANGSLVAGSGIGTGGTQALGNVLTASFTPMTTNVLYTFYVRALNNGVAGTDSTISSSAIYYATPGTPTVNTPTNTGTTLNMTWNAPTGTVTSYTVFVLASGSLTATLTPGLVLTTTFSPMTSSVPYSFNVRATNETVNGGTSLTSATVTFNGAPATPTSLTIDRIGVTFANFTVGSVATATSYTVQVYSVATRTNTGGTAVSGASATSSTTSISILFNFTSYFPAGFYYATVTATSSGGTSSAFTSPSIVTMIGYTGANQTYTSPFSGLVTICLCGGGAAGTQSGAGGSGGLVVATYTIASGTVYTIAIGGGALGGNSHGLPPYTQLLAGAWGGIGGVASGGGGLSPGGGMSQFQNPGPTAYIMAGGGGGGGNSSSLCTDGNGGNGGDGGGTAGTGGGTANPGAGSQSSPGGGGTASAAGAGGAGAVSAAGVAGTVGTGTNGGAGGAGGAGTVQRGAGGGGGYRGGGGGGGLNGVGATGGAGAGSSFTTGVTLVASVVGGAVNGMTDTRFGTQGFNGSCAIIY